MKDFSTDLSELLGLTPPETENAAPAGTGSGVETSAAQKIAFVKDSKSTPKKQAWAALDAAPQWCAWREELRKGKLTKVPYSSPRDMARANDPATWLTRARADAVAADLLSGGRKGGVGLFLGGADDLRFGGIDLDSCRGLLGDLEPWAEEVLARFPSYAEVSPSETGVKVFFRYRAADLEPFAGDPVREVGLQLFARRAYRNRSVPWAQVFHGYGATPRLRARDYRDGRHCRSGMAHHRCRAALQGR